MWGKTTDIPPPLRAASIINTDTYCQFKDSVFTGKRRDTKDDTKGGARVVQNRDAEVNVSALLTLSQC